MIFVYYIAFAILVFFIIKIIYDIINEHIIKRIKLNRMFKANHNCRNCKHCYYYYIRECDLDFHIIRDYAIGEEEKIYKDVNKVIGTRKCHWDPREEKNV